jgi:4-amino-4-deoxy-L-arabinose transferase-like glycosyltransferase
MQASGGPVAGVAPVARVRESPSVAQRLAHRAVLPALLVAGLTVVGVAIRVVVAQQAPFADELSTYWIVSTNGLSGVLSTVHSNAEITPPLSFVAGWLSAQIDGSPEMVRAPSLLAGAVTIPGVYLLGLRTVGRAAAPVATALTALAPFMIFYSAEARGYALMMALVLLSTLAMLVAVDDSRARWWVFYAVASCAAVYTHYTSVFVLGAQLIWLLWAHPEARRPALLANAGAVVAFLPWISGLIKDFDSPTTDILSALQPFDAEHVRISLEHWSIGYPYSIVGLTDVPGVMALLLLGLAVVVAVAGVLLARAGRRLGAESWVPDRRTLLIVALALSTPVGAALFSALGGTTVFSTRNLAASWPALALAFSALLVAAGPRLRFAAVGLAVASFAIGAVKLLDEQYGRPQYQATANFVDRNAAPGDVVIDETGVLSPGPLSHIDPYLARPRRVIRSRAPQENDHPFTVFDRNVPRAEAARRAVAAADGARIFLVTDLSVLKLRRMGSYRLVETRRYDGMIRLAVQVYADRASSRG